MARSRCGASRSWQDAAPLHGAADGWRKLSIWGMGIAEADFTATVIRIRHNLDGRTKLQKLDREAGRRRTAGLQGHRVQVGATAHILQGGDNRPSTGLHSEFADFNNDGLLDLFIAKGNVEQMPDFAAFDPNNLLIGQWNGKFVEAGEGRRHSAEPKRSLAR